MVTTMCVKLTHWSMRKSNDEKRYCDRQVQYDNWPNCLITNNGDVWQLKSKFPI